MKSISGSLTRDSLDSSRWVQNAPSSTELLNQCVICQEDVIVIWLLQFEQKKLNLEVANSVVGNVAFPKEANITYKRCKES